MSEPTARPSDIQRRPTLGVFGPGLDEPTGIARYSALLHPYLSSSYDIWYASNDNDIDPRDFDRVLYQLGASRRHHCAFRAMVKRPGPAIIHDPNCLCYFHEAWDILEDSTREAVLGLCTALVGTSVRTHQEMIAALDAHEVYDRWNAEIGVERLFLPFVTTALVHSSTSARWLRDQYSIRTHIVRQPVPKLRASAGLRARRELGLGDDDLLAGTFGFLGEYKRIEQIVAAWKHWADKPKTALFIIVGEPLYDFRLPDVSQLLHLRHVDDDRFEALEAAVNFAVQLRHPSLGETSAVVATLMANGKPVIVSKTELSADLEGELIIRVAPDDLEIPALIAAFDTLASRPPCSGRVLQFDERHSPQQCAAAIAAILEADAANGADPSAGL